MAAAALDAAARDRLRALAAPAGLAVAGPGPLAGVRRSSSRFCLGVEHGDYNGTELFGVGTDRFLWLAFRANDRGRVRLLSANFADDGIVDFALDALPPPRTPELARRWARFPLGVAWVLRRAGFALTRGFDAVLKSDIPGGGMSRSASLTLNLLLTFAEVNGLRFASDWQVIELAQAVENDYIGSPCGVLDQTMIYFARAGCGTHFRPHDRSVQHVPMGAAPPFCLVSLDTGTDRPGLEHSTYRLRRAECDELAVLLRRDFGCATLADVRDPELLARIVARLQASHPEHCQRLRYVFAAQQRFPRLLRAWRDGDLATVGEVFRADGRDLRDLYRISGPELETMCDIARTVPGVYGERMLGGGDKGAAGAIVAADSVDALRQAVAVAYPRAHPDSAPRAAVHACGLVDGIVSLPPL